MNALVINCSPVRNGATAEIVHIVSEHLKSKFDVKSICIDNGALGRRVAVIIIGGTYTDRCVIIVFNKPEANIVKCLYLTG